MFRPMWVSMHRWDAWMACCLLFVCLVTPVEVAFSSSGYVTGLWYINRVLDLSFVADIGVNMNLAYIDGETNSLVLHRNRIIKRYFKSWFAIDLISSCPFEAIGYFSKNEDMQDFKMLRIVRLLRMIKLLRVLRAARIIRRIKARSGLSLNHFALVNYIVTIVLILHWVS